MILLWFFSLVEHASTPLPVLLYIMITGSAAAKLPGQGTKRIFKSNHRDNKGYAFKKYGVRSGPALNSR